MPLRNDTEALVRLLLDDDREIRSIAGHSKGCLSIAYALGAFTKIASPASQKKAEAIRVVTTGAVVALPGRFSNTAQYLGALDWFGRLNSRLWVAHNIVPSSWHHLNGMMPFHLDFDELLVGEPD
jgi:hypothetical protein